MRITSFGSVARMVAVTALVAPLCARAQNARTNVPVVTLGEARRRAESVAPAVAAARSQTSTAVWERRAATSSLFLPNINAGLSYLHFSDPFFNFGTAAISRTATSATLDASYTILGFSKFADLRRARASVASGEANEVAVKYRTAFETDAAYYSVLADQELARVASDRLRRAEQQLTLARARVTAGDAIATDSLQLFLEVTRARLAVTRSDSAVAVSQLRLGRLIGLSGPAQAAPVNTDSPLDLPLPLDAAIAEMNARGPQVQAARANERRAGAVIGAERAAYLPKLTVAATRGAYDAVLFPSATRRTQIGVTASLPIWNGGQREVAIARARADQSIAVSARKDTERAASELMTASYEGYRTARAGIELAKVGVAVAAENYRVQRARYAEGATTILDVLEAQTALTEAESSLVQSRYSGRLALAEVEALLGRRLFPDSDSPPATLPR